MAAPKALHTITIHPGEPGGGVTARELIDHELRHAHVTCPLCGQTVAIPKEIDREVRSIAAELQGGSTRLLLSIHHPPGIPMTLPVSARPITDPATLAKAQQRAKLVKGK
ncbi:MAG: hypothetical protein LC793_00915 [Thermomicrobia bacterium]|nr:hypothetical protein [Thermomicrobia bacterium]MCA1724466.1 hypothetical protein [Thermomicrobia bacterium]